MSRLILIVFASLCITGAVCNSAVFGQKVYWVDRDLGIRRANLDGSNVETHIRRMPNDPEGVTIHRINRKLYWTSFNRILRSELDGSDMQLLVQHGSGDIDRVAFDYAAGKMYWGVPDFGHIYRSDIDGSNVEFLGAPEWNTHSVVVDPQHDKLFWAARSHSGWEKIQTASLDGSGATDLIGHSSSWIGGMALDEVEQKLYWADSRFGIRRANTDGTGVENVIEFPLGIRDPLVLDVEHQKVYWLDNNRDQFRRANLDGSDVEDLFSIAPCACWGLDVDSLSGTIYWSNAHSDRLLRADLDGTKLNSIVVSIRPSRFTLDLLNAHVYWATDEPTGIETGAGWLRRANWDGSQVIDLLYGAEGYVGAPVLDLMHDEMYWATRYGGSAGPIWRAKIDGTRPVRLTSGTAYSLGLGLDLANRKLYSAGDGWLKRRNLDGTNIENVVEAPAFPDKAPGIALDLANGKIYWAEQSEEYPKIISRIMRSNIDGSDPLSIVSDLEYLGPLVLDSIRGKLYWLDYGTQRIQRSGLDGTNVEDVVFDVNSWPDAGALALDICGRDSGVTLSDQPLLAACWAGPNTFTSGQCFCADFSGDSTVDLVDFALLQRAIDR